MNELKSVAWMIELVVGTHSPSWWNGFEFTKDSNAAIHFPSKASAECVFNICRENAKKGNALRLGRDCYGITEHVWISDAQAEIDRLEESLRAERAVSERLLRRW